MSFLVDLVCTRTGKSYPKNELLNLSEVGAPLFARYDLKAVKESLKKEQLASRTPTMWRYSEVMPVEDEAFRVSLGEGFTPLIQAVSLGKSLGVPNLYIKDEGGNPTGSFKARGMSAAISKAMELGAKAIALPSAGNAGGATAAYCARAGIPSFVFMPKDVPVANRHEVLITGGNLTLVDGLISDAGRASKARAAEEDLFDVSTLQEPYRVEGKKTMGYEIAEQMGWTLPDAIIYPTGGGTGIVGMWKAFAEMEEMGWIGAERPKMFAVQSDGCAPIVRAFDSGDEFAEPWQNAATMAAGIRVPAAIGDYLILGAIRESGGGALTVTDDEILHYMRKVASLEGMFICPEGAATAAALSKLLADGRLSADDNILLLNTGSGLKYLEVL